VLQDSLDNTYVYGLDLISVTDDSSVQTYFLYDGLGSTTELADEDGTVTGTYAYDVFGPVRAHTGAATEWTYTGEQNDPTGLEYLRARYYDPAVGRFLSADPFAGLLIVPQSLNRYPYVLNNPALYVDPYGYWGLGDLWDKTKDAAGAVGGGIKAGAEWTNEHVVQPVVHAVQYCTESAYRLGECVERSTWAALGVGIVGLGVGVAWAGCEAAPAAAAVTAGVGGVVVCGVGLIGGAAMVYAGGQVFYHAFTPWRHAEAAELPAAPGATGRAADGKE
jgi:RHS repeat-associated protein